MSSHLFRILFLAFVALPVVCSPSEDCLKAQVRTIVSDARAIGLVPGRALKGSKIESTVLSKQELQWVDCQLKSFLLAKSKYLCSDIESYRFQYFPFSSSGSRFVAIQGLHKNTLVPLPDGSPNPWRRLSLHIDGGGKGVWQVLMDIKSGSFTDFSVNSPE